jgi:hypothetical protein
VRLTRSLVGVVFAALALAPAGFPAEGGRPVLIDSYGFWSLHKLGYGDVVLKENPKTAKSQVALAFRLPPGAKEGGRHWYIIRLHFRVEVRRDALPGEFNVAADTNGRTCASIIFDVTQRGGRPYVTSDALGLVNGVERIGGRSLVRTIDFRNFLVIPGVRGGVNRLTFDLTSNALPMVRSVKVFADSGIQLSRGGPPSASVAAHVVEADVHAGQTFHVRVELEHRAGIAVPRAVVHVQVPPGVLAGPTVRELRWGSKRPLRTVFAFRALRAARVPLVVRADVAGASPTSEIVVYVAHRR